MSAPGGTHIWQVPLLILAGLAGLAGFAIGIAVWREALPLPWGAAIQWGLAGACLTFTIARIIHARRVGRRELELLLLGAAVLFAAYVVLGALIAAAVGVLALIGGEL